jgi:type VI secretion system protein ImpM
VTGYFGKVSTHGDFVQRRLPPALVAAWDGWLQQCIEASRARLGDAWLARYLTSPVWRFAIAPGVLAAEGLGGVLMPSVDRVGRYYPLMLGATGAPPLLDWFDKHGAWYDALDDLARSSLDPAFVLAQFDALPVPALAPPVAGRVRIALDAGPAAAIAIAAAGLPGHSLWWTEGAPDVEPSLLACAGMPAPGAFASLLDGRWRDAGWDQA